MCTLIALHRCVTGATLVVAANRDEFFERPAEGPALRKTTYGSIVAPRDTRAGGTWFGLNGAGLFAALTNRRCAAPDPARRSRGSIVIDALAEGSAEAAAKQIEALPRDAYNPFNLFLADRSSAVAITYEGAPRRMDLAPGAHVIGNVAPDAAGDPKLSRLSERARRVAEGPPARVLGELGELCRGHDGEGNPLTDACVHTETYGTRSSALLVLGDRGAEQPLDDHFAFADGAPCRSSYLDFTPLLSDLSQASGYAMESQARTGS